MNRRMEQQRMGGRVLTVVVLLGAAVLVSAPAHAEDADGGHAITCASEPVSRLYHQALGEFHQADLTRAEADFRGACQLDPECAMAEWGLSRTLLAEGQGTAAQAAEAKAQELAPNADDREGRLIAAWSRWLKAPAAPAADRQKAMDGVRSDLDMAVVLYPDDPEIWLMRGDACENPLRAGPFYLAALRIQPDQPFGKVWKPAAPPLPALTPLPTKPIGPCKQNPKLFDGLGKLSHPVTTSNPQAQAFYEQGLRLFHGYVMGSGVENSAEWCFQYAANLDPDCALAYWGLSFVVVDSDGMKPVDAANRALELALKNGTDKEKRFCAARVLELGGADKREAFLDALDGAIAAYPDDVELWLWRGKVYSGYNPYGNVPLQSMPYDLAAYRMHPEHPSPNHELIHGYDDLNRPALGWPYSVGFRESAPNLPHANHMQAHLAMRLGRWDEAVECTRMSRQKSREGYPEFNRSHHIDVWLRSLSHAGLFKEVEAEPLVDRESFSWARMLQLEVDTSGMQAWAEKHHTADGDYIGAIAALDRGDLDAARPLVDKIEAEWKKHPNDIYRYSEVKGRYLVATGKADEGLKLLEDAGAKAVKDDSVHEYGGGGYVLEMWGAAALQAHRWDEAEQAFAEALAHEHGSVIGALGLQVVAEQRGQKDAAADYAARAAARWKQADPGALDRQLSRLRKLAGVIDTHNAPGPPVQGL